MDRQTYIDQAEARRKRRERELLALLIYGIPQLGLTGLLDKSYRYGFFAIRHDLDWRKAIDNGIIGNGTKYLPGTQPAIIDTLRRTTVSAENLVAAKLDTSIIKFELPDDLFQSQADDFSNAMAASVKGIFDNAIQQGGTTREIVVRIRQDLETKGWTKENAFSIESGVERSVVSRFNNTVLETAQNPQRLLPKKSGETHQGLGIRHISVVDEVTSAICLDRVDLTLDANDPYWKSGGLPALHPHCRSLLFVIAPPYEVSDWRPTIPPAPGFGYGFYPVLSVGLR